MTALTLLCLLCTACSKGELSPIDDPDEGLGGDPNRGVSEDTVNDFSGFEGIWLGDADNDYDSIEFDSEGNWTLYYGDEVMDDGYLRYESDADAVYAYSNRDDAGDIIEIREGQLYCAAFGYFNPGEGMERIWYGDDENSDDGDEYYADDEDEVPDWNGRLNGDPDSYWSWDSELYQRNVSEFEGTWYYDGDLAADRFIVIDGSGNWSLYERTSDSEANETDYGTFSYSATETSTYYADSALYDGVSYKVFEFDSDTLVWDEEGTFYLMD